MHIAHPAECLADPQIAEIAVIECEARHQSSPLAQHIVGEDGAGRGETAGWNRAEGPTAAGSCPLQIHLHIHVVLPPIAVVQPYGSRREGTQKHGFALDDLTAVDQQCGFLSAFPIDPEGIGAILWHLQLAFPDHPEGSCDLPAPIIGADAWISIPAKIHHSLHPPTYGGAQIRTFVVGGLQAPLTDRQGVEASFLTGFIEVVNNPDVVLLIHHAIGVEIDVQVVASLLRCHLGHADRAGAKPTLADELIRLQVEHVTAHRSGRAAGHTCLNYGSAGKEPQPALAGILFCPLEQRQIRFQAEGTEAGPLRLVVHRGPAVGIGQQHKLLVADGCGAGWIRGIHRDRCQVAQPPTQGFEGLIQGQQVGSHDVDITAGTADQRVPAAAGGQGVGTFAAIEEVVAGATVE